MQPAAHASTRVHWPGASPPMAATRTRSSSAVAGEIARVIASRKVILGGETQWQSCIDSSDPALTFWLGTFESLSRPSSRWECRLTHAWPSSSGAGHHEAVTVGLADIQGQRLDRASFGGSGCINPLDNCSSFQKRGDRRFASSETRRRGNIWLGRSTKGLAATALHCTALHYTAPMTDELTLWKHPSVRSLLEALSVAR